MGTLVSLDGYTQDQLASYNAACEAVREAVAIRDKARAAVIAYLRVNDGNVGTIDGRPVCRLIYFDRVTLDTTALKVEEPFTYRRYSRVTTVEQLRQDGVNP